MTASPDGRLRPVEHYENFPVASWLCPPRLRQPVAAIYWFARTADDLADEGDAPTAQRLNDLETYGNDLQACFSRRSDSGCWPAVFTALRRAIEDFALPQEPLARLLDAFTQDVRKTAAGAGYADRAELLAYCSRSADPVGRLLLHLYGVQDAAALAQGDAICSALQLINFWQDLSVDIPRGRYYLPAEDCRAFGIDPLAPQTWPAHPRAPELIERLCGWAGELMLAGAPLVHRVPGRAGWELRLVVQGGLRVLRRIERMRFRTMHQRPKLGSPDLPPMVWGAARM